MQGVETTQASIQVAVDVRPRTRPEPEPVWVTALAPPPVEAIPPKAFVESVAPPTVVAPSGANGSAPNAAPQIASIGLVNGHPAVRTTRRDYDYFADLDEKLAQLWRDERGDVDGIGPTESPPGAPA